MQPHPLRSKLALSVLACVSVVGGIALVGCKGTADSEIGGAPEPRSTAGSNPDLSKTMAGLMLIRMALDEFAGNNGGQYPLSLDILVQPDMNGARYLEMQTLPRDPWGHEYVYTREPLRLLSHGRDGAPGGTGEDGDVEIAFDTRR